MSLQWKLAKLLKKAAEAERKVLWSILLFVALWDAK